MNTSWQLYYSTLTDYMERLGTIGNAIEMCPSKNLLANVNLSIFYQQRAEREREREYYCNSEVLKRLLGTALKMAGEVIDGQVVRADISVTWNVLS